jgi:hypothetical protein
MMSTKYLELTKMIYQEEKKSRLKTKKRDLVSYLIYSDTITKLKNFFIDITPIFLYREG